MLLHKRSIRLRLRLQLHPLRVLAEFGPALRRGRTTLVPQHINQRASLQRLIVRSPVAHTMHSQPFEDLRLLLAKPLQQRLQFAFEGVIDTQLIHNACVIARGLCRNPARRRQHHRRPNSLQYIPSIHPISSAQHSVCTHSTVIENVATFASEVTPESSSPPKSLEKNPSASY